MAALSPAQIERGFLASTVVAARAVIDCKQPILIMCGTKSKAEAFCTSFPELREIIRAVRFFEEDCFIVVDRVPMQIRDQRV